MFYAYTKTIKKGENTMNDDDEIMTAEEFFGEVANNMGVGSTGAPRKRSGRAKKTFADIKARMVMRIYGVTRAKAERIISDRAAEKVAALAAAKALGAVNDCASDDDELMSAEEFFRG
jgi:hypothetical protein